MTGERIGTIGLFAGLVLAGGLAWWLQLKEPLVPEGSALDALPRSIAGMRAVDVPMESLVERILQADHNLQRAYRDATGALVWLYVGYYGTERGGKPEHTPGACYRGAGWNIDRHRVLEVRPGSDLRVNEFLVSRDDERRLVHFWFRSYRSTGMLGDLDQNIDRLLGRLFDDRADGALVRVSTPLMGYDEVNARSRLLYFASAVDPLLGQHWPREYRRGEEPTRNGSRLAQGPSDAP